MPRPVETPNNWLTTMLSGTIQQAYEKYERAVKR